MITALEGLDGLRLRDRTIILKLAEATADGLTDRQAVLRVVNGGPLAAWGFPGSDRALVEQDITGLQTAVAALAHPSTRSETQTLLTAALKAGDLPDFPRTANPSGRLQVFPTASADASTTAYRLRVLNCGG